MLAQLVMGSTVRPQTTNVVQLYLERESITGMDLPDRLSDQNPIEDVWNKLHVRISARQVQSRSTQELGAILVDDLNTIS
jgi:transposase